jgi:cell division protein FtsL
MSASQSYPTRGKYVAAIIVLSVLFVGASGATAYYYFNPRTVTVTVDHTADLNSQITNLNSQISSDRATIDGLNSQITSLNQRISQLSSGQCTPDTGYVSCSVEITSLQSQVNRLQSDKVALQAQVNDLTDIVNMKKKTVVADSKTLNWSACGDPSQPSCTIQSPYIFPSTFLSFCTSTCYSGYLNLTWTSTQHLTVTFTFSIGVSTGTTTTSTSSASSGTFLIPVAVGGGIGISSGGFHIDGCSIDVFNNIHCPGGTMTYSETYVY